MLCDTLLIESPQREYAIAFLLSFVRRSPRY